jgi:NADPH2:quinone reductase
VRAWQVSRLGEPGEVLTLAEVPDPSPGPGQILVRVRAAAANFPDVLMCRGGYQVRPLLPFTPGIELCGEIVALGAGVASGAGVARLAVGDRVIGGPAAPTGAFGELALMNAGTVAPAPDGLDDAEAAAFFVTYQTGWFGLHRRANLAAGETLLVHAAAGGVGSGAVQLGKAAGARVIGVVGGPGKAEAARALGADVVIDRHREDFVEVVKEVTRGRGADVVYDPVGGETYTRSTKCIAFEGRILVVGFAGGQIPSAALNHVLIKNYSVLGLHWGLYQAKDPQAVADCHRRLGKLVADGAIRPLVGARLGLPDVPEALQRLASGDTIGRLVFLP